MTTVIWAADIGDEYRGAFRTHVMTEWALALFRPSDLADLSRHLRFQSSRTGRVGAQQADARAAAIDAFGPPEWRRLDLRPRVLRAPRAVGR